jgi:hypothetical protein
MAIMDSFIIPIIKTIIIIGVFGTLLIYIFFIFYRAYKVQWKWSLKYSLFKRPINPDDVDWVVKRMDEGCDYVDIKKIMLVAGKSKERTNEIVWIFKTSSNELNKSALKGGLNARPTKRSISKDKSSKLPDQEATARG